MLNHLPVGALARWRAPRCRLMLFAALLLVSAIAACAEEAPYRLAAEDQISVNVARHPEFSGTFLVPADGTVSLPAVGQTAVTGMTLAELAQVVTKKLEARLRSPEVTVTLQAARMQRLYVLGAVEKPGPYDVKQGWRITEAVAAAGGIATGVEQSECRVSILRSGKADRVTATMPDVIRGAPDANIAVQSGDVITVEAQETVPVYVTGKVKTPGLYRLRNDTPGAVQAITVAGGVLENAALSKVTITHLDGTSATVNLVPAIMHGKQEANPNLRGGDLIVVPEDTARIAVLGYVNEPGFYSLNNAESVTLSEALGLAKGIDNKSAKISAIIIVRNEGGKQQATTVNMNKFLRSGDAEGNPSVRAGDVVYVPESSRSNVDFIVRSLTAIGIMAGGLLP